MDEADREAADLAAMMTAVANDVEYVNSLIGAELTKANNRTRSRMFKAACAHKDAQHKQEMDEAEDLIVVMSSLLSAVKSLDDANDWKDWGADVFDAQLRVKPFSDRPTSHNHSEGETGGWISVDDRLPQARGTMSVLLPDGKESMGNYWHVECFWTDWRGDEIFPTHWKPVGPIDSPAKSETCEECGGSGLVPCGKYFTRIIGDQLQEICCPSCNGTGKKPEGDGDQ